MAQLWGGRFTKATDKLVYEFNASIGFDQRFFKEDLQGSRAHVRMLAKQGILTEAERDEILAGLDGIEADVEAGKLEITSEYEDIHSFVEANLIDRIGDAGKKLHTGRSRNDQVALDMRLYTRSQVLYTESQINHLLHTILHIMEEKSYGIFEKTLSVHYMDHRGDRRHLSKRSFPLYFSGISGLSDPGASHAPSFHGFLAGLPYSGERQTQRPFLPHV